MKLIIDAMGGDNAPLEIVKGALSGQKRWGVDVTLTGDTTAILQALEACGEKTLPQGMEIVHTTETVEMCDDPATVFRRKKDTSMGVGLTMLRDGRADAMVSAGLIFVNTNMAAAVACCVTMLYTWLRYKKPDVGMTLNAALAGLVAITAGCDMVSPAGAAIIGIVAGLLLPISVGFFDNVLKIDDPVGAISVHGVCGAIGTLLTGLLAVDGGLFYGGGIHFFLIQCLGVAATAVWAAVTITIVFLILKHTIGLRVSVEEELKGLDITEHGLPSAYAGFAFAYDDTPDDLAEAPAAPVSPAAAVHMDAAVVVETAPGAAKDTTPGKKMTRVDILCKMERFDALKRAMFDIGITGMTAANVMGCGEQRGKTEGYFRGAKVEASMLPSIQVSIVVCKVPVSLVVETARKVLYTGRIGDGKIFVSDVENVIKVRTGEQGYDALQDEAL